MKTRADEGLDITRIAAVLVLIHTSDYFAELFQIVDSDVANLEPVSQLGILLKMPQLIEADISVFIGVQLGEQLCQFLRAPHPVPKQIVREFLVVWLGESQCLLDKKTGNNVPGHNHEEDNVRDKQGGEESTMRQEQFVDLTPVHATACCLEECCRRPPHGAEHVLDCLAFIIRGIEIEGPLQVQQEQLHDEDRPDVERTQEHDYAPEEGADGADDHAKHQAQFLEVVEGA